MSAVAAVTVASAGLIMGSGITSATGTERNGTTGSFLSAASAPKAATVHAATVKGLGAVLVNSQGRTLYLFAPDKRKKVTCVGSCQRAWPPLDVKAKPSAGRGIKASLLGTVKAPGGKTQVTYNHWPLYTFIGDSRAGEASGQGLVAFGGSWFAIRISGQAAASAPPVTSSTTMPWGSRYNQDVGQALDHKRSTSAIPTRRLKSWPPLSGFITHLDEYLDNGATAALRS